MPQPASFFDQQKDVYRREWFVGLTPSNNSRLAADISVVDGYERLAVNAGAAMTTGDSAPTWVKPLLSPSGRHLQWTEVFSFGLRTRHNTATTPDTSSGLGFFAGLCDASCTEYAGGGYFWTGGVPTLRRVLGGASTASGGGSGTIEATWDIGIIGHTLPNRRRMYTLLGTAFDSSAQRVGVPHETTGLNELPTGGVYLFLKVIPFSILAAQEEVDVEIGVLVSEPASSVLAVAR